MKTKILILSTLLSSLALAQTPETNLRDSAEEAIILNQELQFLEETANNVSITKAPERPTQESVQPIPTESLERLYFGEDEDSVSNRAAAPKRRRSTDL